MPSRTNKMTYEEFLIAEKNTDSQLEFIDGQIFMQASPSVVHQQIVTNLSTEFGIYFKKSSCRHFVAPFDVVFENENEKHKVQPDLTVVCDKNGLNTNNYTGIPAIVVEVLSPSTASKDFIFKMDLYMRFKVKEYWIISPKNKEVQVFVLEDEGYGEPISYLKEGIIKSSIFSDMEINLEDIFY